MSTMTKVFDRQLAERMRAERKDAGADKWDEVWDGDYILMPLPNIEHQDLVTGLATAFQITVGWTGLGHVFAGVNVTDRADHWTRNYRCPDVAVYLRDTVAEERDTHWFGGPDFAVEVVSEDDRSREKLDFYSRVNVREFLLVDLDPWSLELFRLIDGRLQPVGRSTLDAPAALVSEVLPLCFRLVPGEGRPRIEVVHREGGQSWAV
jgi:Uma2 family endonuclease